MKNISLGAVVGIAALVFGAGAHAGLLSVDLDFPSEDSMTGGPTGGGPLGAGGGGAHFIAGDDITEVFASTGLPAASTSRWQFQMSDFTASGVVNTFDLLINSVVVGDFSFTGTGGSQIHTFDLTFDHAAIVGDTYTLRMVATSTVPPGLSSWNWFPGGTVTLSIPGPGAAALLGLGALAGRRRRR